MVLQRSAEEAGISDDQPLVVDFDVASKLAIDRLVAIEPAGLKARIALPVGSDSETRQLNVDGEDFLGLARLQAQPADRRRVGERSDRYVDIDRTFKPC